MTEQQANGAGYTAAYDDWRRDPHAWWAAAAEGIAWDATLGRGVRSASQGPFGRWFPGARMNTSFNCLDRHVAAGRGEQAALIWDSPMTGRIETFTYAQMLTAHRETRRRAGARWASGAATAW